MGILKLLIYVSVCIFLIYGFWHEDKFIAFEDRLVDKMGSLITQVIIYKRRIVKKIRKIHRKHI